ncbi:uncharacterized protein LOC135462631 [Liolophura sinensis]|uniref:uncharacterized protein LOC135462631 n=1 Tax=Liolophura sinensis TaxID=3198878 RepID=UPI00315916AA
MSFNGESLKFWARGHKETGGDEAASDVPLALLGTPPSCRHGKVQILTVNLCQDFYSFFLTGWARLKSIAFPLFLGPFNMSWEGCLADCLNDQCACTVWLYFYIHTSFPKHLTWLRYFERLKSIAFPLFLGPFNMSWEGCLADCLNDQCACTVWLYFYIHTSFPKHLTWLRYFERVERT